jgi:hypothetical protein
MSVATLDLGNFLLMETKGGAESALAQTLTATDELISLSKDFPGVPKYQYELANSMNSSAVAYATLGNVSRARSEFENADRVLSELDTNFPDYASTEPKYHSLKGRICGGLGFLLSEANDWTEARQLVDRAIKYQTAASKLRPDNPEFLEFLSQHYWFMATVMRELKLEEQSTEAKSQSNRLARQAADMKSAIRNPSYQ